MRWWLIVAMLLLSGGSRAEDYPSRPVSLVVAAAAGGPIDILARIMAERLTPVLGQNVFVENVGGAGGTLGGQRVVRARPDGYTVLLGTVATHANPLLYGAQPPYNPLTDFVNVALIAEIPLILIARKDLIAHTDLPADTAEDFITLAKANPGKLSYGSAGIGSASHLGCAMLERALDTKFQHVPYRGTGPAMEDLLAGRIDFICDIAVTAVPSIKSGTVKGIANLSSARSAVLPDLPTIAEKGYPGAAASTWAALFLPKGTSAEIAAKLNAAAQTAMNSPGLTEQLNELAATLVPVERRSQAYLSDFVKDEWEKWGVTIRTSASDAIPK
jgi:tripartite-type tricarboxylate transporter receptor subunit TctC